MAVKETKETKETEMTAAAKEAAAEKAPKIYIVTVKNNPKFCGVGAGGVQFAGGEARITSARMAAWFREHSGYTVKTAD